MGYCRDAGLSPGTMRAMNKSSFLIEALGHESSDKRLDILRLIGVTGSISEAARQSGVSYKAAWQAIHTLTNLAGVPLVDRAVGGAGGGGASLTPSGLQLLDAAGQMDAARGEVLARFAGGAAQALPGMALRTSMRNNLPCVAKQLQAPASADPMVRVVMQLPGGDEIASSITRASAELLGLQPGLAVLVLCKATAVIIFAGSPNAREHVNRLAGRVARVSRGTLRDEVVMTLSGDLQLVGFADKPNCLRVGSKVTACIDESALVLALV